jgi:hypothetical protein
VVVTSCSSSCEAVMSVGCALPYRPVHLVPGRVFFVSMFCTTEAGPVVVFEQVNCFTGVVRRLLGLTACVLPTTQDLLSLSVNLYTGVVLS